MSKELFNTEECFEGFNEKEDCYYTGSYSDLIKNDNIVEDTIEWSDMAYSDMKDHFMDYINSEIDSYEKRYKCNVTHIALIGTLGLWRGITIGGKIIRYNDNPLEHMGSMDKIGVKVDDNGNIYLLGSHHDDSHCMELFLMSENKMKKFVPYYDEYNDVEIEDLEEIYENSKQLNSKSKIFREYFGF